MNNLLLLISGWLIVPDLVMMLLLLSSINGMFETSFKFHHFRSFLYILSSQDECA